jgi:AcrR family transcriptional regulator
MHDETAHVNPPRQRRSRRTLERIVRASLEILEDQGPEGLTVQAIVARAGSSVGSFYARFAGKDELVEYLGERVWREAAVRWDEALSSRDWSGLDLGQMVDGAVRLLGEAASSRASTLRALEQTPGSRDDAYRAFHGHVISGLEELLLARSDEMAHPDPPVAVPLGLRAVLSILDGQGPTAGGDPLPPERRMEEASTLLMAYLAGGAQGPTGSRDVDFFDIWG